MSEHKIPYRQVDPRWLVEPSGVWPMLIFFSVLAGMFIWFVYFFLEVTA